MLYIYSIVINLQDKKMNNEDDLHSKLEKNFGKILGVLIYIVILKKLRCGVVSL